MNPHLQQMLIDTRIAEIRSDADRHRIARTARRARRATSRPAGEPIAGPDSARHHILSALLTTFDQRRQPATVAAQAPEGLHT